MFKLNRILSLLIMVVTLSHAYADVMLYGKIVAGVEDDQFQNTTVPGTGSVQDYGSYFGIRGNEVLTNQSSFIWQVEQLLDISSGQSYYSTTAGGQVVPSGSAPSVGHDTVSYNQFATGDSYMGLRGEWGQIRLGNLSSYMRSNMGTVDVFNYGDGQNGLATWSRTSSNVILPNSIGYNSLAWNGITIGMLYSWDNLGQTGFNSEVAVPSYGNGLNGNYSGGVYSFGVAWSNSNFGVNLGGLIWPTVGKYPSNSVSGGNPAGVTNASIYGNAYAMRLELSYNDPDGVFMGLGVQSTNGLGWTAWANSGGSFNNYTANSGYNYAGLNSAEYQTQEFATSIGYHLGVWAPKIGYAYGNNLMYNTSIGGALGGGNNQIPNSGYQQFVAELDWNIDPETIMFLNFGQIWYGNTLQNISYCGVSCNGGNPVGTVNATNQEFFNQSTIGFGLSHTF